MPQPKITKALGASCLILEIGVWRQLFFPVLLIVARQIGVPETPEGVVSRLVGPRLQIHVSEFFQRRVKMTPDDVGRRQRLPVPALK
jgi:hypothetical protein